MSIQAVGMEGRAPFGDHEPPHVVYRALNEYYELLYVGVTSHFYKRMKQHAQTAPWWSEAYFINRVPYWTRADANRAEACIIDAENPRYNKARGVPFTDWTALALSSSPRWDDLREAVV